MQRIFFFRLESSTLALMSENRRNKLRDVEFRVLADRVAHLVAQWPKRPPSPSPRERQQPRCVIGKNPRKQVSVANLKPTRLKRWIPAFAGMSEE
jgi:hypothetical protein